MSDGDALRAIATDWDERAATFDDEPDHGLTDSRVRTAWAERLRSWLPPAPCDVVDLGCGTGTLSELVAEHGHRVTGVDLSARMVDRARCKTRASGAAATFVVGDATAPPLPRASADVVLARHVIWALPDPLSALRRWVDLLRPRGRLVLVEGVWAPATRPADAEQAALTGRLPWSGGMSAEALVAAVEPLVTRLEVHDLSDVAALWGRPVHDERYTVVAHLDR